MRSYDEAKQFQQKQGSLQNVSVILVTSLRKIIQPGTKVEENGQPILVED